MVPYCFLTKQTNKPIADSSLPHSLRILEA